MLTTSLFPRFTCCCEQIFLLCDGGCTVSRRTQQKAGDDEFLRRDGAVHLFYYPLLLKLLLLHEHSGRVFTQVRDEDPHLLTVGFNLQPFTCLSYTQHFNSSLKEPPYSLSPLLIPVKSRYYEKNPSISPSSISSYRFISWYDAILPLCYCSGPFYYFQDDQKYTTIKSPTAPRARAGPRMTPIFLINLCPTSQTPSADWSDTRLPHARCSEDLLATSSASPNSSHLALQLNTHAKEIWIIISGWYDWVQSQGEVMEMQKHQRWEMKSMHWRI